jgi:hypothetical protein
LLFSTSSTVGTEPLWRYGAVAKIPSSGGTLGNGSSGPPGHLAVEHVVYQPTNAGVM